MHRPKQAHYTLTKQHHGEEEEEEGEKEEEDEEDKEEDDDGHDDHDEEERTTTQSQQRQQQQQQQQHTATLLPTTIANNIRTTHRARAWGESKSSTAVRTKPITIPLTPRVGTLGRAYLCQPHKHKSILLLYSPRAAVRSASDRT